MEALSTHDLIYCIVAIIAIIVAAIAVIMSICALVFTLYTVIKYGQLNINAKFKFTEIY